MKAIQKLAWALLTTVLMGCEGERAEHEPGEAHEISEVQLSEKNKGIRLPPELQSELGVITVEVAEKSVTRRVEKIAQVYRAAAGETQAGAVAWLDDGESKDLVAGKSVTLRTPYESSDLGAQQNNLATGKLVRLQKSSSAASGQIEALIEFNDAGGRFRVGSSLVVVFEADRAHTALSVPESAVVHGAGGAFVYAANGGYFVRTPVKPSASAEGWVEITDGLYGGDVVVVKAVDSLWLIELCALKGGTPCCPVPTKKRDE